MQRSIKILSDKCCTVDARAPQDASVWEKNTKKTSELDRFSWFLFFICVFSTFPLPTKPPQKISPLQPTQLPTSVACVLRSSRRCCRKARAKRNSELSTPATYGGRHPTSGVDRTMEKRTKKKGLEFLFWGGLLVVVGSFLLGKRFLGGKMLYMLFVGWLIWQLPTTIVTLMAQHLVSHYDTHGEIAHCGNLALSKHCHYK